MILRLITVAVLFILAVLCPVARSQTATVTGHAIYPANSAPTNANVCFTLLGYKPNMPKVSGIGAIINQTNFCIAVSSADGSFSTPLFQNTFINPNTTSWRVDYLYNNVQQFSAAYLVNASPFSLDTAIPLAVIPSALPQSVVTNSFICSISVAATTWTCTHNLNDSFVVTEVFDNTNKVLWPDTIVNTTPNITTLTFINPVAGNARIVSTAAINIATSQPNAVVQNPQGSQAIVGGFGLSLNGSPVTTTFATGTVALGTSAINSLTCSVVNVPVTGLLATDTVTLSFNAPPTGAYLTGLIVQLPDVGVGSFNVRVCNPTAGNLTPPAATLNYGARR